MTTNTTPNLLGSYLSGAILTAVRHYEMNESSALALLSSLEMAHEKFPSLSSSDILREIAEVRQMLQEQQMYHIEQERIKREAAQEDERYEQYLRFRDLDGDHHEPERTRQPEEDYPG